MQQLDAGPKGAVHRLPQEPVRQSRRSGRLHGQSKGGVRLQPDHKLVFKADWPTPEARLQGVRGSCPAARRDRRGQAKKAA